jgi:predicted nucleic acid-binding Zn ribbon protein
MICPNCKKEETMINEGAWGMCGACGWRGNPLAFGIATPKPDPYAVARGMGARMKAVWDD